MAITQSQSKVPASTNNIAVGKYHDTGVAAAFKVTTGFQPRYVYVVNIDASGYVKVEWFEGMTAAYALKTAANGDIAMISSNGITVAADGFTIGLDTDLNVTDEQLYWMAMG
jgi:hypothetical protein